MSYAGPELPDEAHRPEALIGAVLDDKYRLDAYLGECATGWVFAGAHVWIHKKLVIKVLSPERAECEEIVKRLQREAVATARLSHPNVVQVNDCGKLDDGWVYLVLEHIEGGSLRETIDQAPLELGRALRILRQLASAVACAHDLGMVHRDIRPENIALIQQPRDPELAKLFDFGVAATSEAELSGPSGEPEVVGTPGYMPPEQAQGRVVDGRADLYALGVTLCEMLTGVRPFEGSDAEAILQEQRRPLLPMAQRLPGLVIPASLSRLMDRLLAAAPEQRLASADELIVALDALLDELGKTSSAAATSQRVGNPTGESLGDTSSDQTDDGDGDGDDEPAPQTRISASFGLAGPRAEQSGKPSSIRVAEEAPAPPEPAAGTEAAHPSDAGAESGTKVAEPPTGATSSTTGQDAEPITDRRPALAQRAADPSPPMPSAEPERDAPAAEASSAAHSAVAPQPASEEAVEVDATDIVEDDEDSDLNVFEALQSPQPSAPPQAAPSPAAAEPPPFFSDTPNHGRFSGELPPAAPSSRPAGAASPTQSSVPPSLSSRPTLERVSNTEQHSAPPVAGPATLASGRPLPRPPALPPLPPPPIPARPSSPPRGWPKSAATGPQHGLERPRGPSKK